MMLFDWLLRGMICVSAVSGVVARDGFSIIRSGVVDPERFFIRIHSMRTASGIRQRVFAALWLCHGCI